MRSASWPRVRQQPAQYVAALARILTYPWTIRNVPQPFTPEDIRGQAWDSKNLRGTVVVVNAVPAGNARARAALSAAPGAVSVSPWRANRLVRAVLCATITGTQIPRRRL